MQPRKAPNLKGQVRIKKGGTFMAVLILNVSIFLLLGTQVIIREFLKVQKDEPMVYAKMAPPPKLKLKPPETAGGKGSANPLDPSALVVPPTTASAQVVTSIVAPVTFTMPQFTTVSMEMPQVNIAQGNSFSQDHSFSSSTAGGNSLFGLPDSGGAPLLTGFLCDLKQTPDHQATGMDAAKWIGTLRSFIQDGWDDSRMAGYYSTKNPLFTDRLAISTRPSREAPKAFAVENEVKPGMWYVHYRCKVIPPETGDYKFAGFGDNVLVVKMGGKLVLDAGWDSATTDPTLHDTFPDKWSPVYERYHLGKRSLIKVGPAFHGEAGVPMDMDVLISDGGGVCSFFLLIMNTQHTYELLPDGTPKLPFFQIGQSAAPSFSNIEEHPPYSTTPEAWSGTN